jgi:hypothetical protein
VNADFSAAVVAFTDGSRLDFIHRVGERRAESIRGGSEETAIASILLAQMTGFRLNAKHLDIAFGDGSRWEARFR